MALVRGGLALLVMGVTGWAQAGRNWGVERSSFRDPVTGRTVWELTGPKGQASNLYFHFPNYTADNRHVIFSSDRTGTPQIYRLAVDSGEIVQLTDEAGVGAAGASPDRADARRVYYPRGGEIWVVDPETAKSARVGGLPGPAKGGLSQPSLSGDGQWMAVSFQRSETEWEIGRMHTRTGEYRKVIAQGFRIGHVQHSPTDDLIFYVWETGGYAPQRTWLVNTDGSGNRPFYASTDPKKWATPLKEWITHEAWVERTGDMTMIADKLGVLLVKTDGTWRILKEGNYWHAAAQPDGKRAVMDDFDGRLWLLDTTTGSTTLLATGLRTAGAIHLHPSFDRTGRYVLFNFTRDGRQTLAWVDLNADRPGL